ncbi:AMP-binding protein [Actinocorallia longicatena]|uniref:AMP-binding protein n=1 Tax=Actinocorallia longicatena TaxID=111803 RepID=A0ABP6QAZ6_9ACTN
METFAKLLLARADDDRPGLLFEDESCTWAEVVRKARERAPLIRSLSGGPARPGNRAAHIGVLLDNVPEYVFWLAAAALEGAVIVGINPTRRGAELAADIRHTDCDLVVTDAALEPLLAEADVPRLIVGTDGYAEALRDAPRGTGTVPSPADRLLLLFTSGSTGAPKAVSCSQGRLAVIAEMGGTFGITRDSVTYVAMPLCHGNSIMANLAMAVRAGATVVLRRRFSASEFAADVRRHGVTYFNYVGRALAYILAAGHADPGCTLEAAFGTEASAQDRRAFGERFGCSVVEGYGSSEGSIAIRRTPQTPPDALGVAQHGVEILVIDPETGRECPRAVFDEGGRMLNPSAIGELVGLNSSFEGYYNNPAADAERLQDGNYHSGDLGYRDEAGFYYFAGRGGDWLRVDSENFAAAPVERILSRWEPVVMCAVHPVPDARTGDQVMAALELGGPFDPDAFAAFLSAQRDLGTKWAPRFVRIIGRMPLTATNKVDKKPLRAAGWTTGDPVWWRPGRELRYIPFEDHHRLRAEFREHGRENLLP